MLRLILLPEGPFPSYQVSSLWQRAVQRSFLHSGSVDSPVSLLVLDGKVNGRIGLMQ
jgi:hypothetical protein